MKRVIFVAFGLLTLQVSLAQTAGPLSSRELKRIDSLKERLAGSKSDTNRVKTLRALSFAFGIYQEEALPYARESAALALKLDNKRLQSAALNWLAIILQFRGRTPEALTYLLQALQISEDIKNKNLIGENTKQIGVIYLFQKDYEKAKPILWRSKSMLEETGNNFQLAITLSTLGEVHYAAGSHDSALLYQQKAFEVGLKSRNFFSVASALIGLGNIYDKKGKPSTSLEYYRQSLTYRIPAFLGDAFLAMAKTFEKTGLPDSALYYGKLAFDTARGEGQAPASQLAASRFLSEWYDGKNNAEAYKFLKISNSLADSLRLDEEALKIQNISFQEQQNQQALAAARTEAKNKLRLYVGLGVLFSLLIISVLLLRNLRHKQRANEKLEKQKKEIEAQRAKTEQALEELKATQQQLVQREKMASLGELTAGIAHEIQNPLNFINNFSDVNTELIDELEQKADQGQIAELKSIANDIKNNEQKINHHGKRADAIVKNMLQHSRLSAGKKELIDINALADEYLRLAYHGLRAKDKNFNAAFTTHLDESLDKINLEPQEIGRVLLNLYNNAFYAVNEKKKILNGTFEPTVTITTKRVGNKIELSVKDNGNGIRHNIVDKIFQPFFTTKPTGQGTGLGLSLSYDIIKAHGGELKVESKEGEGSVFTIII